ncbi:class IV lanthionine synthetase LanL [Microtetraspora sp. AC03309]|uniref:class IV lanthionine synthetase LanL n=1 Tax=Microtetraspora sp. AC03309 TaxID=2779376 RepID=UPI001E5B4989|nr:class IV lanthionine synthetase LanL [Microtetraspora sp. AC03309]MCC5578819.1 class IV lanthionine synthetase LanL [Microtetraspora sp. AC03309]
MDKVERPEGDRFLLQDVARAALIRVAGQEAATANAVAGSGAESSECPVSPGSADIAGWEVRPGTPWTYVTPVGSTTRPQGWKLHVSATPLSAPLVLARVVEVLGRHQCAFKFASNLQELVGLISRETDRGSVGKFVTVYPPDDETAVVIAEELHSATYALSGPPILSDRAYRPGSLVHYRYGVFSAPSELGNDGTYDSRLTAPDGTKEFDRRDAWYSPPAWAACPFESGQAPPKATRPEQVLLGDRFMVRKAIRHSAKGGVFRAEDRLEGGEVVIKQARPHLGASIDGRDMRDLLRHEARMLDLFAPLGVTARNVALFEQDDNLFLAQELLPGIALSSWVGDRHRADSDAAWFGIVLRLSRSLVALVSTVHGQGYVLRDLTPNNVMITPELECRLIDLELASVPGAVVQRNFTPGYAAPEQRASAIHSPAPGAAVDLYALGATLYHLSTASAPLLLDDEPLGARSRDARLATLVSVATAGDPVATAMAPLLLGLMAEDPEERWDLKRVEEFLDELSARSVPSVVSAGVPEVYGLGLSEQDRLIEDGIAYMLQAMSADALADPRPRGTLWPARGYGAAADPCAVQYGSAGVLNLLAAILRTDSGEVLPAEARADAGTVLREAAAWTTRRLVGEHRPSPGLYFGRAGIAWGLFEAGRSLGDEALNATGTEMALALPVSWPNPDVCHGLAGTGLALLHFWRATGDARFGDRARECADALLKAAQHAAGAVLWPVPADFDSSLAGVVHYGFAHGVAGIATFLLAVGAALDRADCLETAMAAGETLLAAAEYRGGTAWWPETPDGGGMMPHWCSGSSGVGTFLVRLHAAGGDPRFREAAESAAASVYARRLVSGTSACHGLAGDGQFLLDLADFLGEPGYRAQAEELAGVLWSRAVVRDGSLVVPDENGMAVTVGWNAGLAGILGFLHRLRHGGPRPWMADAKRDSLARVAVR